MARAMFVFFTIVAFGHICKSQGAFNLDLEIKRQNFGIYTYNYHSKIGVKIEP